LRPAPYADGNTVECAVVTLSIVVYNFARLFTIIARSLQFFAWSLLLCFRAELTTCVCVDFVNFSRRPNAGNRHSVV
jgi:hypothetical protein